MITHYSFPNSGCSFAVKLTRTLTSLPWPAVACLTILLSQQIASGAFHFWAVTEVYSSADGTVQFIEMTASTGGQQYVAGQYIRSQYSTGAQNFQFPTNLPSDTAGRTCIIGTSNLALIPGGVVPDFFIPNNFIRPAVTGGTATVSYLASYGGGTIAYTNLPTDGELSLTRSGANIVLATNSPKNFSGQANTIVPVKLVSANVVSNSFVLTFRTSTGPNGSAGPNYAVEALSGPSFNNWTVVTNVSGNGNSKTVALPFSPFINRFFRLRAP